MPCAALYISDFAAWAFLRRERSNLPLIVVAGGRVTAASPALRRIGVEAGMTAERVQALVPEVVVRLRDSSFEQAAWEEVLQTVNRYTPFLESTEPGIAFFQPPDLIEDTRAMARALEVRIGIGPHRSTALLAALKPASGTVLLVERRHVASFLEQYPIGELRALKFEETFLERMELFGYTTLSKAGTLRRRHLAAQFGEEGLRLHTLLHPEVPEKPVPLYRPSPAITTCYDFEDPVSEPGDLLPALEYLVERSGNRLGEQRCQRIKIDLQCAAPANNRFSCRILPEPLHAPHRIMHTARTLLFDILKPSMQVEVLTLELSALRRPGVEQGSLFARRPALNRAVESVHRRFPGVVKRAVLHDDAIFPEEKAGLEEWE